MSSIHSNYGIQKPRGLENAELQQYKHQNKESKQDIDTQKTITNKGIALQHYLIDKVEIGNSESSPNISYTPSLFQRPDDYSTTNKQKVTKIANIPLTDKSFLLSSKVNGSSTVETDNGNDTMLIGNGAKVNWSSTVGTDNGNDTVLIGNGAKVNWSSTVGTDNGNDTVLIGNGAKVNWSSTVGTDNGNDTVLIGNGAKVNWSSTVGTDNGNDTVLIGNGVKVNWSSTVGTDNGNDTVLIGNGAEVNWSSTVGTDNGNDTVLIGNGAEVNWSSSVDTDNGNNMLTIGNGAKVSLNSIKGTSEGSRTLIIGEGAIIEITGNLSVDNSTGSGITYLNGKVHFNLIDEKNQSFQLELLMENPKEAISIQEFILNKIKNNKIELNDFAQFINNIQEQSKEMKVKKADSLKNIELMQPKNFIPKNKQQVRLEMMQSLVQNLLQYKLHANKGFYKGIQHLIDKKI